MADTKTTWNASPFVGEIETITATDDELRDILDQAELPPLLPALAYATGDLTILQEHLRPDPLLMAMPQGGLTEEQQEEIVEEFREFIDQVNPEDFAS